MSNSVYPVLAGLGWSVIKTPKWSTAKQETASGREVRLGFFSSPLYRFQFIYNLLRSGTIAGNPYTELQQLMDFFNSMKGDFDDFLLDDPSDDSVTDMAFGSGDGSTTAFQLTRTIYTGGFVDPVMNVNTLTNVKVAGVAKTLGVDFTISSTGLVTFTAAPANGAALTWTGTYYYRCRFDMDDEMDFEEFYWQLWTAKKVRVYGGLGVKI